MAVAVNLPLLEHQRGDIEWIHRVTRGLLGNEPGLGKSRSAIEAFDSAERKLVIAPNLIVESGTWDDELAKWSHNPDTWQVATYSMLNQRVRTGRGSGTKPVKALRDEVRGRYDAVVIDEAHYVKGRETSWTWATEQITRRADAVMLMTGTPIPNWAHELFMLLRILYPGEAHPGRKYGSFWRWAEEWFDCSPTRFSQGMPVAGEMLACTPACLILPVSQVCDHYRAFTQANLGDYFRRVLREDALDLPPITTTEVNTPMSAATRKAYRQLAKDFATDIDDEEVLAWSQGAKNVMLDKMTTSPQLLTEGGAATRGGKLDRLAFDLASRSRPTLVLAHYRDSVEACVNVARTVGATAAPVHGGVSSGTRASAVRAFKDGKLDVLVGSLETISEGLTLTVADTAIFVEKSYKPSRNEQARYRIHRMGQIRPVTIIEYVTPNSVDMNKRKLLDTKTDRQMRVLTAAQFKALL